MNRRDFIAGAVGGFIVGAGIGYSIGKGKPTPPPTQSDSTGGKPLAAPTIVGELSERKRPAS
jgi:hypothetical protein